MTIRDSYTYSWFANLSYVNWSDAAWKGAVNAKAAIDDSRNAGRVSGTDSAPIDTLGERIFRDQQWRVLDYQANDSVGFSASLFQKGNSTEKVLAIRGTEGDGVQIALDALRADFGEIGILGMALSQTVSMVNYIYRLRNPVGYNNLIQFHWDWGTAPPSSTLPSITVAPGLKIWLTATYDGVGLGNLLDPTPGMAVTAEVKMGQRRVIEFLLSPLLRYKQESGRER